MKKNRDFRMFLMISFFLSTKCISVENTFVSVEENVKPFQFEIMINDVALQVVQANLFVAQNQKIGAVHRLQSANILNMMAGFKRQAAQAYFSIARDENLLPIYRLRATNVLLNNKSPEFFQQAADIALRIAQNPNTNAQSRLYAASMLQEIPQFFQPFSEIFLDIAQDPMIDVEFRLYAINVIFSSKLPHENSLLETVKDIFRLCSSEDGEN